MVTCWLSRKAVNKVDIHMQQPRRSVDARCALAYLGLDLADIELRGEFLPLRGIPAASLNKVEIMNVELRRKFLPLRNSCR